MPVASNDLLPLQNESIPDAPRFGAIPRPRRVPDWASRAVILEATDFQPDLSLVRGRSVGILVVLGFQQSLDTVV